MPRSFYPRTIPIRPGTNKRYQLAAAPVEVAIARTIPDWSALNSYDIVNQDGTVYRAICRAPFDGYVSRAEYTIDVAITGDEDFSWSYWLINAEDNGEGRWPITDPLDTTTSAFPLQTLEFDQNSDLELPEVHPRGDWVVVQEGDLIAFRAMTDSDLNAELVVIPTVPSGLVTVWFKRFGGR